jgi:hypothetical protein
VDASAARESAGAMTIAMANSEHAASFRMFFFILILTFFGVRWILTGKKLRIFFREFNLFTMRPR